MSDEVDIEIRLLKIKVAVLLILAALAFALISYRFNNSNEEIAYCGVVEEPKTFCGTDYTEPMSSKIFRDNCSACHSIRENKLVGPGLKGCFNRFPYEGWFNDFMLNQDSLILVKEPYLLKLKNESQMEFTHQFTHLTNEEIKELEAYLKENI